MANGLFFETKNGFKGTLPEIILILDDYHLDEIQQFYDDYFCQDLKTAIRPYMNRRMMCYVQGWDHKKSEI